MQPNNKVTATDSDTITRVMRKPLIRGFKILTKQFGVQADIYAPVENSGSIHGYLDDANINKLTPYYQGKVLIPSLFRRRNSTSLAAFDPFIDSENYLYVQSEIEFLLHSLIVCRMPSGKILKYRIHSQAEVGNDAGRIIQRYDIVPVLSVKTDYEQNELKKAMEKELADNPETFTQTETEKDRRKYHYEPLS